MTCSDSCKSALSRNKRQQADTACVMAWHWQPGDGERLIRQFGLPRMEQALNARGVYWFPAEKCWRFKTESEKEAA